MKAQEKPEEKYQINPGLAVVRGGRWGLVASAVIITLIMVKFGFDRYFFRTWVESQKAKNQTEITQICTDKDFMQAPLVPWSKSIKSERTKPIYANMIGSCCVLALDDKSQGTHYMGHFQASDGWEKIVDSINKSFFNKSGLEAFVVAGRAVPDSIAARNIYFALRVEHLTKNARYFESDAVLMKEGKLYYPRH